MLFDLVRQIFYYPKESPGQYRILEIAEPVQESVHSCRSGLVGLAAYDCFRDKHRGDTQ